MTQRRGVILRFHVLKETESGAVVKPPTQKIFELLHLHKVYSSAFYAQCV